MPKKVSKRPAKRVAKRAAKRPAKRAIKRLAKRAPDGSAIKRVITDVGELEQGPASISLIVIEKLFGEFDYIIPGDLDQRDFSQLLVLYGDNGTGKTTILRLLFDALSVIQRRGSKTRLANTPFHLLQINFNNGSKIIFRKKSGLIGAFRASFHHPSRPRKHIDVETEDDGSVKPGTTGSQELFDALAELGIDFYFLTDNRDFNSSVSSLEEESGWRSISDMSEEQPPVLRIHRSPQEFSLDELRVREIIFAIRRLEQWVQQKVLQGSSVGDESAHAVLMAVLKQLAHDSAGYEEASDIRSEIARVKTLSKRSETFSSFGLQRVLPAADFDRVLKNVKKEVQPLISNLLHSFLNGYEAKLGALQEIRDLIELFLKTINSYFAFKKVFFSIEVGLKIELPNGKILSPSLLSSGEKQLLLLLCNTLIARDRKSIFLIDEPELSLNVKWQRKLIDSLVQCVGDTQNQFIIATHSIELLSRHRDQVVKLGS